GRPGGCRAGGSRTGQERPRRAGPPHHLRGQQEAPSMTQHHTRPAPDPEQVIRTAWPTDGPYTAQRTVTAARAAAELARYLAYATRPAARLPQPADAH